MLEPFPRPLLALMFGSALAGCASPLPSHEPPMPMRERQASLFEAEIHVVAPFAAPLVGHCNEPVTIERLGAGRGAAWDYVASWRVRGCENDLKLHLECRDLAESAKGGAYVTNDLEALKERPYSCEATSWPAVVDDRDIDVLALETALREVNRLPSKPECPTALLVRSVPGARSAQTSFEAERCGVGERVDVVCGGSPIQCVRHTTDQSKPRFERSVSVVAKDPHWTYWVAAAGTLVHSRNENAFDVAVGVGSDLTFRFLEYRRFPLGIEPTFLDVTELRAGPWIAASTRSDEGDVEGGATMSVGNPFHPSWGALSARVGVGYGAFVSERATHGSIGLAWGRTWLARSADGSTLATSGVARLVVMCRPLLSAPGWETTLGVELTPALLFPGAMTIPSPG